MLAAANIMQRWIGCQLPLRDGPGDARLGDTERSGVSGLEGLTWDSHWSSQAMTRDST